LMAIGEDESSRLLETASTAVLARLTGSRTGFLCDAIAVPACGQELVHVMQTGMTAPLADGELAAVSLKGLAEAVGDPQTLVPSQLLRSERFNATLVFDERLTLKTFRSVETEINPDFEIRTFLSARQEDPIVAPVLGYIEYRRVHGPPVTVAVLNRYIPNQGTAWNLTINQLSQFYERVAAHSHSRTSETPSDPDPGVHDPGAEASLEEIIGGFESIARKIGIQTALLHRTLASDSRVADFRPEPFGRLYQRSLYQAMRNLTHQVFTRLTRELPRLTEPVKADAARLLGLREPLLERFRKVADTPLAGSRIRIHGDYELDQLVYTGTDFVVIDFEADFDDSSGERRVKRSPLRDVAAMIRSFDYAAHSVLFDLEHKEGRPPGLVRREDRSALEPWARRWQSRISRQFVDAYFESLDRPGLVPATRSECEFLLDVILLERTLDDVGRDMARRPDWMVVPLRALLRMLEPEAHPPSNEALGV